jgi:hypothetical protein
MKEYEDLEHEIRRLRQEVGEAAVQSVQGEK